MYGRCAYSRAVPKLDIRWDAAKERSNRRKHGVSFAEAATAFADESGLVLPDPDHSRDEPRFVLLGLGVALRALIVVHSYDERAGTIRIISARKANRLERALYARKETVRS
ncbi:MAG: BrnT family toxin [Deltaproteobacteria bacterium]|nr:BrnT family toxin [Deltaproteobacteria bacterium]